MAHSFAQLLRLATAYRQGIKAQGPGTTGSRILQNKLDLLLGPLGFIL